ncbi:MAG: FHA domain-containing protein, partial [Dolichospermum sp.]|nr:FHA domain-containing protein [Dolichospermum sp.]
MTNLQIQLSWEDPATGERREPKLNIPIAFGREFARLPTEIQGQRVSRMLLNSHEVSRYHALIEWEENHLFVIDQNSANGVYVNGQKQTRCQLANGDTVQMGPYLIIVQFGINTLISPPRNPSTIQFNPHTNLPDSTVSPLPVVTPVGSNFPPPFFQAEKVEI